MLQLFCQCSASSVRPAVRAHRPRPPVRARTSGPHPNTVRAQRLDPFAPRLWLAPKAVRARSCFGWRPARFRGQPPQTANRHVGGQQ
jgi:hypothetical protein